MHSDQCKIKKAEAIKNILDAQHAPNITECKKTFWNSEICVNCRLIHRKSDRILLFYEIEKQWNIDGMIIEPPMFTIATYWTDRPYNLYCWFKKDGAYASAYFNVVQLPGYRFKNNKLTYRDLVLDVLSRPNQRPVVLDKKELTDMDKGTSTRAKRVSELLLESAGQIINQSLSALPTWLKID